ncbi:M48 family metalloprotease [Methylocystis parvus]|uniref:M48 family metalloprotease n=1 Tax=Methylocystis parvus TaxID=134 RepID=A0A6B8M2J4_9HYPH|nr:M48 family metalloprotease [Methylocystis parvus]QGM96472.1 M48 family metalloprotease [Methylocystis parvus]WBJ99677.1 M48 family metalloprotease [Methylocystis parvus OBBP]
MLPARGLYGHIRNNNAKSLLLLGAFLLLFEFLALAVTHARFLNVQLAGERFLQWTTRAPENAPALQTEAQKENAAKRKAGKEKGVNDVVKILDSPFFQSFRRNLWWQTLIGAFCWFAVAWVFFKHAVIRATGAEPVERRDEPRLYNIVENLSILAGVPRPSIHVIETLARNAFSAGLSPSSSVIAVTRGLLDRLDDRELTAVLAHEITHIKNGDIRLAAAASLFCGILFRSAWDVLTAPKLGKDPRAYIALVFMLPFVTVALAIVVWAVVVVILGGWLVRFLFSRSRDFMADAGAVELTKDPEALASALRKIEGRESLEGVDVAVEAMLFASANGGPLSTHPSPRERIAALRLAVPDMASAAAVSSAAERKTKLGYLEIKAAAGRMPKWVSSRWILFPASALSLVLAYGVGEIVDPTMNDTMTAWWSAYLPGADTKAITAKLNAAFNMDAGEFSSQSLAERKSEIGAQPAACFPLNGLDAYDPGSAAFRPPPVDDAAMRRGFVPSNMDGIIFAWRGRLLLESAASRCPRENCAGKALADYKEALRDYVRARVGLARGFDRRYGAAGLAFAQDYYKRASHPELMADLRARMAQGQVDPREFPNYYDAVLLAAEKPPESFKPCRTDAEWRASAFPAPAPAPATKAGVSKPYPMVSRAALGK